MKRHFGLFVLGSLLASSAAAQTRIEALDRYFAALARHRDFNGNVLAAEKGMRNLDRRQVVVVFDVAHDRARPVALDALKIINGEKVPSPKASLVKIYGKAPATDGAEAARRDFEALMAKTDQYDWSEDGLNSLGYDFMGDSNPFHMPEKHRYAEALEVFQLNVRLFPASWNVYDSCGEVLLKLGRKEEAAAMYRKSVELNPGNENGKKALETLKAPQLQSVVL